MNEMLALNEATALQGKKINLRKLTILIVDPNEFARTFIRSICRNLHFGNILTTGSTTEAYDLIKQNPVHLIVCDWSLEPLSSVDFTKKIRSSTEIRNIAVPIIILTSSGSPEEIVAARDAGVDDYLTRPIVMRRLLNSFVSVLCAPRVFVQAPSYVGPCRRRKKMPYNGPERRAEYLAKMAEAEGKPPQPANEEQKPVAIVSTQPETNEAAEEEDDKDQTSLEELEKAGEAAIAQEADNYSKVRLDDIAEIFELVRAIKEPHAPMKSTVERIYKKALDVKGMGDTFGFPLLTRVGDLLCGFVFGADPESFRSLSKLQVIETHAIIMKMIVDSNMHDEADELAKELLGELEVMVDKFKDA